MPWGSDDWLLDRSARQGFVRMAGVFELLKLILRSEATPREGLACLLDEVLGDRSAARDAGLERRLRADARKMATWLQSELKAARKAKARFQSLAVVVYAEGDDPELELTTVEGPVSGPEDWLERISWRGERRLPQAVPASWRPTLGALPERVERELLHVVPLASAALLLRDTVSKLDIALRRGVTQAIVVYSDGDSVLVPLKAPGR
jgi:hypothetical protein